MEDAKTEVGWGEFCVQKYQTWEHHLTLTALARQLEVEVLPALLTANVRELLKAVMPLPQLTADQATDLVIMHLVRRARSTSSRLKKHQQYGGST